MPRFEQRAIGRFWEVEVDDRVVTTCAGAIGGDRPKPATVEHVDADAAYFAATSAIRKQRRRGFVDAGPSQVLAGAEAWTGAGSTILLDEFFERGDDRFGAELRRTTAAAKLGALAARWYRDPRPWARAQLLAYLDDGCDRPHHKQLVKQLFKLAEAAGDDLAMAGFLVAFDRLTRRSLVAVSRYDWQTRVTATTHVLREDASVINRLVRAGRPTLDSPVFSRVTRRYLARRAARYFRYLGHRDPARYRAAMLVALARYTDAALGTTTRLLDAWGLAHALYGGSPVLVHDPRGLRLAPDRRLDELAPAPQIPAAWQGAFADVWRLLLDARSRAVRAWALAWLRAHHAAELAALPFGDVATLLRSPHADVAALGVERLAHTRGLETVPLATWLELLGLGDLDVVAAVVAVVERVVTPARTTLAQCLDLAGAPIAAVAELGLAWARTKPIATVDDLHLIARLARARVATVRAAGAAWALELAAAHPAVDHTFVRDLCDAPFAEVRAPALAVAAADPRFAAVPALWFALTESPYDDVRAAVLAHATRWHATATPATLQWVWSAAILAVHRGSKTKAGVPRAIADRVVAHPDEADQLLPMLALALHSVRAPERAAALTALARALHRDPALAARARVHLPTLSVSAEVIR